MFNPIKKDSAYLRNKIFVGFVEENIDKTRKGRIKVRVQGVFENIDVEHIPWASPFRSLDGKNFSVPAVGKIVNVIFPHDGNIYEPQYIYSENYNINLQNKLDDMVDEDYINFVSLLFDHRTQIYSDDEHLRLDYYFNQLTIHEDGINVHLKDNNQELHLGHDLADQSAVLGDHWMTWFDKFMQTLLTPTTLVGNFGAPILRPALDQVILEYQAKRQTFLSQHVKIVDNAACRDLGSERENTPTKDDFTELNEEKFLESEKTGEKAKEKVKEEREKDAEKSKVNEPDEEDKSETVEGASNGEMGSDGRTYGDSYYDGPTDEKLKAAENQDEKVFDDVLSDDDKVLVQKNRELENRKNTPKSKTLSNSQKEEVAEANNDPYGGFWAGRKGRKQSTFKQTQPGYGTYSYNGGMGGGSGTAGTFVATGGQCNRISAKSRDGTKGYLYTTTPLGEIENGKIDPNMLSKTWNQFNIWNGSKYIKQFLLLEENAAAAWSALNDEFIKKWGQPIPVSGHLSHYRTFQQQQQLWNNYKNDTGNLAAVPGSSNHGWGIALDLDGMYTPGGDRGATSDRFDYVYTEKYNWLYENGQQFEITNPSWARDRAPGQDEPWHWEYVGKNIYCGHRAQSTQPSAGEGILLLGGLDSKPDNLDINEQVDLLKKGVDNSINVKGFRYSDSASIIKAIKDNPKKVVITFSKGCSYASKLAQAVKDAGGDLNRMFIIEPYWSKSKDYYNTSVTDAVAIGVPAKNVWHGGYEASGQGLVEGATQTKSCSITITGTNQPGHFCALYEVGKYIIGKA